MTEVPAATDGESGETQSPTSGVSKISGALTAAASAIAPIIELLQSSGMAPAAQAVEGLVSGLNGGAAKIQEVMSAVGDNKEGGGVGQILGGAEALLGPETGSEGGEGEDGEQSFLDKAREKVSALKSIWDKYHNDLRDKDGKLNKSKLANMALEVGTTILGAKKMAAIRKVLAIGNIIRNNAEAISKAATAAPPPWNIPLIAIATAIGVKQLATVKGQAHDGLTSVPSTGTYMLEKGERVVGSRLNADLQGFLAAQNSGQGDTSFATNNSSVTNSPTINLTINGDADENAVDNNRGALEGMIRDIFADYAMEAPFA